MESSSTRLATDVGKRDDLATLQAELAKRALAQVAEVATAEARLRAA